MRRDRMTGARGSVVALAGGLMLAAAVAGAQSPQGTQSAQISDAQVEADVLKALAGATDLATQNIQSSTVYGVVTLSGNVHSEAQRTEAENLTAKTVGVKKVVDELQLGDTPPPQQATGAADQAPPPGWVLQSDGTYAPPASDQSQPQGSQPATQGQTAQQQPSYSQQQPAYSQPQQQPGYAQAPQQGYPQQQPYPNQPGYAPRQPMYAAQPGYVPPPGASAGQHAGIPATVPQGAELQIRINRGLDSKHTQPGATFDGTVLNDIVANGVVAVPRGAQVSGVVVDAKKAGVLKGRGELALQLNSLTLGGQVYPLNTDVWQREGKDKTTGTVDRAVGLGALGAIFGAVAGGGTGAAIGAGVGGAAGVASSAASGGGQIVIPPESMLSFHIAQPLPVQTVSEQEMARLAYSAGPGQPVRPAMRRYCRPYYGCYWGPVAPPPPPPPGY
jgi:hypothetical protein